VKGIFLGIDIGSTTVKVVVLDRATTLLAHRYLRANGQPRQTLVRAAEDLFQQFDSSQIRGVGLTGSGGEPIARLIGGHHVNELITQTRAVGEFYPEARTVIELGGQDSKFLSLQWDHEAGKMILVDFAMNALCAAGTGSFLDQQAARLGISIQDQFAALALQSKNPARVAGRCTVFAKSDMIHLQQKGTPLPDILAGLCLALTRNFKSVIGKGKAFVPPILFQGGVAYNRAVAWAFESVLNLKPGQLIVPDNHSVMSALGAALVTMDEEAEGGLPAFHGFDSLVECVRTNTSDRRSMPPLAPYVRQVACGEVTPRPDTRDPSPVYLGIDVGSISTNVVLIDKQARVVARRYLPTAGKPLEAVRRTLREIGHEVGHRVIVRSVGTTGSGRYLTGDFVGADVVRNEITAQARAATAIDPTVDTVFEIGGQDSKYVCLDHGTVVDFAMNNACAAGTGSFLEEQAERLKIDIKEDFSRLALSSASPMCLGERCTVFMESDLIHHQQQGARVDELTGGLAYSIAQNYLNRVVDGRPIGKSILFQGGVAGNQSVAAALRALTGCEITVPPHHDITGAIGVAILAMEALAERRRRNERRGPRERETSAGEGAADWPTTKFRGFDLNERHYRATVFECRACPNLCEVRKVVISGEPPIFYGARCDKFEEAGRAQHRCKKKQVPDLFAERNTLLLGDYEPPNGRRNGRLRLAIPRALVFYDLFPYWRTFFKSLDIELVLSAGTNPKTISNTLEHAAAETCFPVKLVYGHVIDLLEQDADFIFLPSVVNRENVAPGQLHNTYCPFIPAATHLVRARLDVDARGHRILEFPLHMLWEKAKKRELKYLAQQVGVSSRRIARATAEAAAAQREFYAALRRQGREILNNLDDEQLAVVIVGRPYNTCDGGACQDLPFKLRKLGVLPIPMDYLSLDTVDLSARYENMFWRSGQDILAAATVIRDEPRLHAIYLTNFNCGPDSFIINFFREIMGDKPFLELEIDDHTADAGTITRCEAFFESLKMGKGHLRG
jgi:predicted CoA-substrate-specific enzyme activase